MPAKLTKPNDSKEPNALRREEKKALTRQLVLAAALAEFREKGYEAASTAAIAQRANVSHGTVFTVEATKEKLAVAAFGDEVRSVGAQAFARAFVDGGNLVEAVMNIFSALFDFYEGHHLISRVLLREMLLSAQPSGQTANDRLLSDYLVGLQKLVEAATPSETASKAKKSTPGVDGEALAAALLGVYVVFLLARLNGAYPTREIHLATCRRAVQSVLGPDWQLPRLALFQ